MTDELSRCRAVAIRNPSSELVATGWPQRVSGARMQVAGGIVTRVSPQQKLAEKAKAKAPRASEKRREENLKANIDTALRSLENAMSRVNKTVKALRCNYKKLEALKKPRS